MRKKTKHGRRRRDWLLGLLPRRVQIGLERIGQLLEHDPVADMTRAQRLAVRNIRVVFLVARWEVLRSLKLHAQALTYATMLSLVPALAVVFAILKGFGATAGITDRLQGFLIGNISSTPQLQQKLGGYIETFVGNVDAGHIGIPSIIILIWSVLMLLGHIEASFNDVFGIREQRPLATRLLTYWAVLTFGPLLLVASFALTAWFQTSRMATFSAGLGGISGFFFSALPLLVTWVGFTAMYLFVPNTRVRLGPAFFAAVVAGSAWNLAKAGYAFYASNAITLQNIYGSLAVIPLFIVWLYASWLLVLFGAQLAFAFQNAKTYRREDERLDAGQTFMERAACRIFLEVARNFCVGLPAPNAEQLTASLRLPRRLLQTLVLRLREGGLVQLTEPDEGVIPATDPEQVTVEDLLALLRRGHTSDPCLVSDEARLFLDDLIERGEQEGLKATASMTFRELAHRFPPDTSGGAAHTPRPEPQKAHDERDV